MSTEISAWPSACKPCSAALLAETDGFDADRLERIGRVMGEYRAQGKIPGAVILLQRNGAEPRCIVVGSGDDDKTVPMKRESLFRIGSMTKPIVSVAALTLVEEGRLRLSDPVAAWLPELARPTVLTSAKAKWPTGFRPGAASPWKIC